MAKELPIIINPNPILRKKSIPLKLSEINSASFRRLLADMEETMLKKDGAGLAAPQIGRNIRLVVLAKEKTTLFMINPRICTKSWAKSVAEEGCLSVMSEDGEIIYGPVARHKKVSCAYIDEKGQNRKISATDMLARAIQHEIDHLDGILFIDKLSGGKK